MSELVSQSVNQETVINLFKTLRVKDGSCTVYRMYMDPDKHMTSVHDSLCFNNN